jgi:membrane peptidoglycan carboxypeptidase
MNFTQITSEDYGLASALGGFTKGVSPLEMAAGFATIENDGVYRNPTCILTILDSDSNVVYTSQVLQEVVYSETAARMTTQGLVAVMEEGTGKKHSLSDMPSAGKTGTTNQNKDGWFVGFTRYYTTSVWVGCDMPKAVEELKGSTYPGTIWNTFMTKLHEGIAPMDFLPYAQLSDDFLDAQEEENNRYTETDENGEENPENADGESTDGDAASDGDDVTDEDLPDEADADGEQADEENAEDAQPGGENADDANADEESMDGDDVEGEDANEDDGNGRNPEEENAENIENETPDDGAVEDVPAENENPDDDSVDESGYRG